MMKGGVADPGCITALSEGQRECLRLVAQHRSSKEIARELNISPFTVDKRLEQALRKLGVSNRWEAARLYSLYEGVVYEPSTIEDFGEAAPFSFRLTDWEGTATGGANEAPIEVGKPVAEMVPVTWLALPFPRTRGEKNELTTTQRLLWAAAICVIGIMASALLLVALESLGRLI